MLSFKRFLALNEGGNAVEEFTSGSRATSEEIKKALLFTAEATGLKYNDLVDGVLGSTQHVLSGHRKDSGDLDIALETTAVDQKEVVAKMKKAVNGEAHFSPGLNTYSFAVPVAEDKKIQVDLMFVGNKNWSKFAYNTSPNSKHKGAVRNQIMFAVVLNKQEPGKDFVLKDEAGNTIARASRSMKFDVGIERLFKVAKLKKDGTRKKTLDKVTPEELKLELETIDPKMKNKFEPNADIIVDPKIAVEWMFGPGVKPEDINTAEKVIATIRRKFSKEEADKILAQAVENLNNNNLPIPDELSQ